MKVRREVQGVIFDELNGRKKVMLVKKKDRRKHRHFWRLLKGGVKTGETDAEALEREVFEELGLREIKVLQQVHSYEFIFRDTKHVVHSFLVKANSKEKVTPQRAEIAEYTWTTKENALKMLHWNNEKEAVKRLKSQVQ